MAKPVTHYNQMIFSLSPTFSVKKVTFDKVRAIFDSIAKIGAGFLLGKASHPDLSYPVAHLTALSICGLAGSYFCKKPRIFFDSDRKVRVTRYALTSLSLIGASFLAAQADNRCSPVSLSYPVLGLAALSAFGLIGGCAFHKPIPTYPLLVSTQEIENLGLTATIHELCEMDVHRKEVPCSLERMREIIEDLKSRNLLYVLNSIVKSSSLDSDLYYPYYPHTYPKKMLKPLHHWVWKGDVEATKLLITSGAADYCRGMKKDRYDTISALYLSALCGHEEITDLLLEHGATADISFGPISHAFIPRLIFEFCQSRKIPTKGAACLRKILSNLQQNHPKSLEYQLKIPVSLKGGNCLVWLSLCSKQLEFESEQDLADQLISVLEDFGATMDSVFSRKELEKLGLIKYNFSSLEERSHEILKDK